MRMFMILVSAAAMAATLPALAQGQGQGQGKGKGGGGPAAEAQQAKGKGQARAERGEARGEGRQARQQEPRGGGRREARQAERGKDRAQREQPRGQQRQAERREVRQREARRGEERAVRDARREQQRVARDSRTSRERSVRDARRGEERPVRERRAIRVDDRRDWGQWAERRRSVADDRSRFDGRSWRDRRIVPAALGRDCPPGLARQNAFCMPPGQLRKARAIGQRVSFADLNYNVPERYRYRFADGDRHIFRYGDGAVYRLDRASGIVQSVIPLYGTGLFVGEPMPLGYEVYNVPFQYRPLYRDTGDWMYRYDDRAIYRVNSETRLVEGIAALLTGGAGGLAGLGAGDMLPGGYDVYNVPFDHRGRYHDTDDSWYRYADGNIYQVDPTTRLIQAVISLLV